MKHFWFIFEIWNDASYWALWYTLGFTIFMKTLKNSNRNKLHFAIKSIPPAKICQILKVQFLSSVYLLSLREVSNFRWFCLSYCSNNTLVAINVITCDCN